MNNIKLYLLLTALFFGLKVNAESVFGQGGQWNLDFAANALTEFNALEADSDWVAALQNLPDNTWMKASPQGIPALPSRFRSEVPMVYMPAFKAMFFTAGDGEELGSYNSDSWAYSLSANTWVQMWPNYIRNLPFTPGNPLHNQEPYPTDRPAARCSMGLGFDTDRGILVLRGGANTGSQGRFTWEYNPATNAWKRTSPRDNGYPRAEDNNLGFIPGFGAVEVGGNRNAGASETWVYQSDATGWSEVSTNGAPPGSHNSRLVWASKQQRLIFWAGTSQLWAFDPVTSTWENISPTSGPSPAGLYRQGIAYDLANDVVIMYGNNSAGSLITGPWVYSFETRTWQDMDPVLGPADGGFGRQQAQHMAYDIEHNVIVITGSGRGTWVYRYKQGGPTVAMPTIFPDSGSFELSAEVSLSSETPGASIRYTTDGSTPDNNSTLYSNPFTVTTSVTVKAVAFIEELVSSTASASYTITGPDLTSPTLVSANAPNTSTEINVLFSEAVTTESAQTAANYQVSDGIQVMSAILDMDDKTVYLQTDSLIPDFVYTVTVNNVQDTSFNANEILPNSSVPVMFESAMGFDNGLLPFGWTPFTLSRWSVVLDNGDNALFLNTTVYNPSAGLGLGEYIISPDNYTDFTLKVLAKTNEPSGNTNADFALVFGFESEDNYFYMLFNRTQDNTQLFKVVNGTRQEIGTATITTDWLTDDEYHAVEVSRVADSIEVKFDGNVVLQKTDNSFPIGRIGVGSYNDSSYFDDIRISNNSALNDLIFSGTFE